MKSIESNTEHTYIIKKSKFITKLYRVNTEEEILSLLNDLRQEYKDIKRIIKAI